MITERPSRVMFERVSILHHCNFKWNTKFLFWTTGKSAEGRLPSRPNCLSNPPQIDLRVYRWVWLRACLGHVLTVTQALCSITHCIRKCAWFTATNANAQPLAVKLTFQKILKWIRANWIPQGYTCSGFWGSSCNFFTLPQSFFHVGVDCC